MIYYEILKHTSIYIIISTIFRGLQRHTQGFDCMGEKHLKEAVTDTMSIIGYCLFSLRQNQANIPIYVSVTVMFSPPSSQ